MPRRTSGQRIPRKAARLLDFSPLSLAARGETGYFHTATEII
jgi:hypothetical protein